MPQRQSGIGIVITYNTQSAQQVQTSPQSSSIVPSLEMLDTTSNEWTSLSPMTVARAGLAAHIYDGTLFAIGGTDGAKVYPTTEIYDILEDTWTTGPNMITPRAFFQSVIHNGFIYCVGGFTADALGNNSITQSVERYDIINSVWENLTDMPTNYGIMMGVSHVVNNTIYVLGGYAGVSGTYNDSVLIYNIGSNTWTTNNNLTTLELTLSQRLMPFSFVDGQYIYVIDGLYYSQPPPTVNSDGTTTPSDPLVQYLPDVYQYDSVSGQITRAERYFNNLPRARYSGATANLGNAEYFLGGISSISNTLRFVEEINTLTSPFSYTDFSRLPNGRSSFAAVGYGGEYGSSIFVLGGLVNPQNADFLQVVLQPVPLQVNLDGEQTANIRINVTDENGESPSAVKVILQGTASISSDVVLFTQDQIEVNNGYALATLIPRADDGFGPIQMSDNISRSYTVTVSGSVVDEVFYGDTTSSSIPPANSSGLSIGQSGPQQSSIKLPANFEQIFNYNTTISANSANPGSYVTVGNIGGVLNLTPTAQVGGTNASILYSGTIPWLPQITPVIETNAGDYETIIADINRLSQQDCFGGSPLYDSIYTAGFIMNLDITGSPRNVYLLSDGEEENSNNSLANTISELVNISSPGPATLIASLFRIVPDNLFTSQGIRGNATDIEQIATNTDGSVTYVVSEDNITESISETLKTPGFIGNGTYTCGIDLGDEFLIQSITTNFVLPNSTIAYWRYSYANENLQFSLFTDRLTANQTVTLYNVYARYINFIVEFDATLELDAYNPQLLVPPRLTSIDIVYNQPTESYIYLNPTNNIVADPQQIVVTMDATRPLGSEILFGVNDQLTGNWNDYNTPAVPAVENNSRIVIPIRQPLASTYTLEQLVSIDGFIFEAKYGPWPQNAEVVVYQNGTTVIPATNYKLIPQKGRIIFAEKSTSAYVISITNTPNLSVAVKITNRVHGQPVQIGGAGYMFTTLQPQVASAPPTLLPTAQNVLVIPLQPNVNSVFTANYTFEDLSGLLEANTVISWYVNGTVQADVQNLQSWSNPTYDLVKSGDSVYFTVTPTADGGNGNYISGATISSLPVVVS